MVHALLRKYACGRLRTLSETENWELETAKKEERKSEIENIETPEMMLKNSRVTSYVVLSVYFLAGEARVVCVPLGAIRLHRLRLAYASISCVHLSHFRHGRGR